MLDNLSTGFHWAVPAERAVRRGRCRRPGRWCAGCSAQHDRRDHPLRRLDRGAGFGRRPARLLPQQHLQIARADRLRRWRARSGISSSPRPRRSTACRSRIPVGEDARLEPISPYGRSKLMTEMMLRDTAAGASARATWRCAISTSPAPIPRAAPGSRRARDPSDQGRGADGARRAAASRRVRHRLSDARRHLRPRLHPCQRSHRAPISPRSDYLRAGRRQPGAELRLWAGLLGARGDRRGEVAPPARLSRAHRPAPAGRSGRARRLGRPHRRGARLAARLDDLDTIVEHALAWERRLIENRSSPPLKSRSRPPVAARFCLFSAASAPHNRASVDES